MPPSPGRGTHNGDDLCSLEQTIVPNQTTKRKIGVVWSTEEDETLLRAVLEEHEDENGDEDWDTIAKLFPGKSAVQCLKRYLMLKQQHQEETQSARGSIVPADLSSSPSQDRETTEATQQDASHGKEDEAASEEDDEDVPPSPKKRSRLPPASEGAGTWTQDELELLKKLVETYRDSAPKWNQVSENFPNHTAIECLTKWQSITNPPVIKGKGSWTAEEDAILMEKRQLYGRKWAKIASHLPGRQGKQCRERFVNHLDPALRKGEWTDDEEAILIAMHQQYGNRWANIAKNLPGRSDNDVKNHWYSTIQRKFSTHGKDKLTEAAVQQVQLMQSMGTMPSQQQRPQHDYRNQYSATTATPGHPPLAIPPHPMYAYPGHYAFPPPHPPVARANNGDNDQSTHHSPPHPHPWYAHIPPPHPYYPHHYGQPPSGVVGAGKEIKQEAKNGENEAGSVTLNAGRGTPTSSAENGTNGRDSDD